MTDLNYLLKNADLIEHYGHRHEHPVSFFVFVNMNVLQKKPRFASALFFISFIH